MIKDCTCTHAAQDRIYGKGKRVHNPTQKPKDSLKKHFRCTVCGELRP